MYLKHCIPHIEYYLCTAYQRIQIIINIFDTQIDMGVSLDRA
jgi:hypothetical protein